MMEETKPYPQKIEQFEAIGQQFCDDLKSEKIILFQNKDLTAIKIIIDLITNGIKCIEEAIADMETFPGEDVRMGIAQYIMKPDPIKGLPFNKELVVMMLKTQIELYRKQLEELSFE